MYFELLNRMKPLVFTDSINETSYKQKTTKNSKNREILGKTKTCNAFYRFKTVFFDICWATESKGVTIFDFFDD